MCVPSRARDYMCRELEKSLNAVMVEPVPMRMRSEQRAPDVGGMRVVSARAREEREMGTG